MYTQKLLRWWPTRFCWQISRTPRSRRTLHPTCDVRGIRSTDNGTSACRRQRCTPLVWRFISFIINFFLLTPLHGKFPEKKKKNVLRSFAAAAAAISYIHAVYILTCVIIIRCYARPSIISCKHVRHEYRRKTTSERDKRTDRQNGGKKTQAKSKFTSFWRTSARSAADLQSIIIDRFNVNITWRTIITIIIP